MEETSLLHWQHPWQADVTTGQVFALEVSSWLAGRCYSRKDHCVLQHSTFRGWRPINVFKICIRKTISEKSNFSLCFLFGCLLSLNLSWTHGHCPCKIWPPWGKKELWTFSICGELFSNFHISSQRAWHFMIRTTLKLILKILLSNYTRISAKM